MRALAAALLCLAIGASAQAQVLTVAPSDTTPSVLAAHKGKRITLVLRSGKELSGTVRDASDRLVVLAEVAGREFFDAAVPLEAIEAVLVRTRQ